MKYKVVLESSEEGFAVSVPDLPGFRDDTESNPQKQTTALTIHIAR